MRADDASLKAIDMAPPHLLAWNADQAVRIDVADRMITARSSHLLCRDESGPSSWGSGA